LATSNHQKEARSPQTRAIEPHTLKNFRLKERLIWRTEFETLEQAREEVHAYINSYHDRPHSGLNYRTPAEVRKTWDDAKDALHKTAA
jgi:putative transposase